MPQTNDSRVVRTLSKAMQEAILSLNARGRAKGHILAFLTVFVWGITFVSTKVLLTVVTPIEILFLRFSLGFLALCVIHHRVTPFMGARVEAMFALAGATGVTLYFLMENIALTMTSASNVGVIVAIAPLFIALIATFVTREERVGVKFFAGFVMAISGIALISFTGAAAGDAGLAGCLLAVLAALAWAAYSTIGKRIAKLGLSTVATTKRTFAWGLVFMLPFLPMMGFGQGAEGAGLAGLLDPVMLGNLLFFGADRLCYLLCHVEQGGVDRRRRERERLPLPYSRGDGGCVRHCARRASHLANRAWRGAYRDRPRLVGALGGLLLAIRRGVTSSATRRSIRSDRFQGRASRAPRTMCGLLLPRPWSRIGFSSRTTSSASPRHGRLRVSARAAPRLRTCRPIPQGRFRAGI